MRLIYIALAWTAGIILAQHTTITPFAWAVLAGQLVIVTFFARHNRDYRFPALLVMVLAFGALRMSLYPSTSDIATYNNTGGLTIEGVVTSDPDIRDDRVQFQVAAETVTRIGQTLSTDGLILVQAPRSSNIRYGDRVQATGLLITPAEYDTFSYADFLARSSVFSIMRNAAVDVVSTGHGSPFYSTIFNLQTNAENIITSNLPEPQAGLLTGILLGNERGISPQLSDDFAATGAAHVIAISGFNMAILSGIITTSLNKITSRRWLAAILGISIIVLYTIFVGANPAVVRAALMSSLLVIGEALRRKTYVPASLAFVTLMLSILNPTVLWDISFQLSFFATLGLALFATPLTTRFDSVLERYFSARMGRFISDTLKEPVIVSLASLALTLPLTILYFNRVSLVVLVVNLLIVPVQSYILFSGGLALLTGLIFPPLAQLLFWFCMLLLSWTIGIVRLFAMLPFAQTEFSLPTRLIFLFFIFVIGVAVMQASQPVWWINFKRFIRSRPVTNTTLFAGVSTLALIILISLSRPDGKLHVWMMDIGHSNGVLVQTPGGAQILIDGGRFPSRLLTAIGDNIPFNDREIELLILSQPDPFDYGALPPLLDRYDIGAVLYNGQPNIAPEFAALQEQLARHEMITVSAGYTAELSDGVKLEVLHPQHQPDLVDEIDDHALVLRLTYGKVSFLFNSDLSQEGQWELLESENWPVASMMTMPQHGTQRSLSEEFLEAVQPQVLLLQSDPANLRGDPDGDIMAMVEGIRLFRTDESGMIHIASDGKQLWVYENEKRRN